MSTEFDELQLRQYAERDLSHDPFTLATRRVTPDRRVTPTRRLVESRRATETRRSMANRPESVPRRLTAARRTTDARRATDSRRADDETHTRDTLLHELQVHQIELEMQNDNLRQTLLELEQARDRYVDFYDLAPVGYLTLNDKGMISEINLTGAAMIGVERHALLNHRFSQFLNPEYRDRLYRHFLHALASDDTQSCELALQRGDNSEMNVQLDCMCLNKLGQAPLLRVVLTDITERIKSEEAIRKLAFYDTLTQLPNRRLLDDRIKQTMAACRRSGEYAALMFLDLDNFKPLNDHYGHGMGDLLLIEVAQRLLSCVRGIDTVARFGGDEFVVLLRELDTDESVSRAQTALVADKILAALAEPYRLTSHPADQTTITVEHRCTSSIGVVLFQDQVHNCEELIKNADIAMYQAKHDGRNRIHFVNPDFVPDTIDCRLTTTDRNPHE